MKTYFILAIISEAVPHLPQWKDRHWLCRLVCAQWPFESTDFYRRCTVDRPAAINDQNYLLVVTVLTMIILLRGQFILQTMHMILST